MIANAMILLLALIGISIPVGAALGLLGLVLDPLYSMLPLSNAMGEIAWSANNEFLLVAIPLFIMLGEVLLRSGFAERMYSAMSLWLSWLPGGLMHANIGASTLFSATSGSSVATAATVGTVAIPQIRRHGYNESLFLGSIAAGGTLGILIPPSINLVIYGKPRNHSPCGIHSGVASVELAVDDWAHDMATTSNPYHVRQTMNTPSPTSASQSTAAATRTGRYW